MNECVGSWAFSHCKPCNDIVERQYYGHILLKIFECIWIVDVRCLCVCESKYKEKQIENISKNFAI